jgi:hypothetical protein
MKASFSILKPKLHNGGGSYEAEPTSGNTLDTGECKLGLYSIGIELLAFDAKYYIHTSIMLW